ncbi:MAG: Fe(3+) ABC transporter substrate-binding protein [Rhodospirillales bacterium]|jgi:iron(III) transport system substrate-binding protein|nr:Fe(3+) ABC transporter substrate-binding protein [Rhodospirillales bacterium]
MTNERLLAAATHAAKTAVCCLLAVSWTASSRAADSEVNLYSYRQPFLIRPILEEFTRQTDIRVNIVYAKKGILERLKAEGRNSPADAVLTTDVGRLHDMAEAGILQPVRSAVLERNIPPSYRHPDGLWFGLTLRARVLFVSKDRVAPHEATSYADLASPHLKERVCIRSGKHVYNVSLLAAMVARNGRDAARNWLSGVKKNLARRPQGNDRAQAKAIKEGLCDVALANTYYMGKMATNETNPEQKEWAAALRIVFPDQQGHGAHVNISGAALSASAKNRDNAVKLIEFLSGQAAQRMYAEINLEYPVRPDIAPSPLVASWGSFKADSINLAEVAKFRTMATRLVDQVGFDH